MDRFADGVAAELRKLVEKWRNQAMRTNEAKYQDGDFLECSKELEPLIARLEAPGPALEELRQAARDEALREVENAISYFFDTHKGTINTNVACDTLLGRVKALAKFSQPSDGDKADGK